MTGNALALPQKDSHIPETGTVYVVIWAHNQMGRNWTRKTILGYVTSIQEFHEYVARRPEYEMSGNISTKTREEVDGIHTTYIYITEANKLA